MDLKFSLDQRIAILSDNGKWAKELNLISWGDNEPKYDIRPWNSDHSKMGKGITLTESELIALKEVLDDLF